MKSKRFTKKNIVITLAATLSAIGASQVAARTFTDSNFNGIVASPTEDLHYTAPNIKIESETPNIVVKAWEVGTTTYIGNDETKTITINANKPNNNYAIVAIAQGSGVKSPHIELKAQDKIVIDSKKWGIQAQNNTQDPTRPENGTSVKIQAKTVDIKTDNVAIYAFSNSRVDIEGDHISIVRRIPQSNGFKGLMQIRGNSVVNINADKKGTVILDGDIMFTSFAPNSTDGNLINGDVTINLTGPDSRWTGCAIKSTGAQGVDAGFVTHDHYGPVTDFKVVITDGAKWEMNNVSYASSVTLENGGTIHVQEKATVANFVDMSLNGGVISMEGNANQKLTSLGTTGQGTVVLKTTKTGETLTAPKIDMKGSTQGANVDVKLNGATADDFKDPATALASLDANVKLSDMGGTLTLSGDDVRGDYTQSLKSDGTKGNVVAHKNTKLDGYSSIYSLGAIQWRHETDSLLKRMGELRDATGDVGGWARVYGSEQEYGDQNVKAQNTTIQVGADVAVGSGWKVGSAFAYTDGDTSFANGSGKSDMYGLSVYGTWFGENGSFVDLIGKYARLSNDFKSGDMKGTYDNNAFSLSAEFGHRFNLTDIAFIEPATALTYGRIMGDTFTASNGVTVEQEDYDSLIARLGVRSGFYFPNNKGTIYARAAVLHDFMGNAESTAHKVNNSGDLITENLKDELGGTWVEYGLGANFRLSDTAYSYVDLERTSGSEVTENWKFTIGVRKDF